ncbi:MAG: dihydroneopterin aldolase [Chthoniobacterales bacterium]|nr:dihydroneopterin aldolase [Chthoniobacterales bacterium]
MSHSRDTADAIHIQELELAARVGVPEEERAKPQRLTLSLTVWPIAGFHELQDELAKTVNYSGVCREIKKLVSGRTDRLIETLAEEIAVDLLRSFPIAKVRLELRKFVLADAKYVAVKITRP